MITKFIKSIFPFSFKRSVKEHLGVPSLHWSLQNLKKKGFNPTQVVDIGAYEGGWTKDFLEVYPQSNILMIEAQPQKESILKLLKNKNIDYIIALVSSDDNLEVNFYENETASHINFSNIIDLNSTKIVKTKSLNTILSEKNITYPNFLKLDVQGHEIEVLKGCLNVLANVEICLLEVTLIKLGDNDVLFTELNNFMDAQGFQVYDITQFMRRPFDRAMYQMDVMYIKKDSEFVNDRNW
ncbi:MAG: FkbM family methyltransferase [Ferruginibacter sp.]|nr:FkbM family methyltransferase [Ferruginibacter sp.]